MSFSNEVKNEIFTFIEKNPDRKFACLYGIMFYAKRMASNMIIIQSENIEVIKFTESLFNELFKGKIIINIDASRRIRNSVLYSIKIASREELSLIFDFYETGKRENILSSRNLKSSFLAGAFLICGSVNSPRKDYHLEFKTSDEAKAYIISDILSGIRTKVKISERRNNYIVYLKESESIEDVLTYIGATNSTLEIMNIKILKTFNNKANRIRNCDTANINKTVNASYNQIENIKIIDNSIGLENISEELREVAMIRMNNFEMTLQEIGESLKNPISRSGVNHRFKKISAIAERIKNGDLKNNEKK